MFRPVTALIILILSVGTALADTAARTQAGDFRLALAREAA